MTSYLWKRREIKVSEEYVSEKFLCITHLPKEILEFIFLFLDGVSLIRCSEVCVNWHSLSRDNLIWRLICKRDKIRLFWIPEEQQKIEYLREQDWRSIWKLLYLFEHNIFHDSTNRNGIGTFIDPDGAFYRGEWKNNMKEGRGIHEWPDKSRYEGEWSKDKRNGFGVYIWEDGRKFVGYHEDDRRCKGTFYWPEGFSYYGEYKNSLRHGKGKFTWPDGDYFDGYWHLGCRKGTGTFTCVQKGHEGVFLQEAWREESFTFTNKGPLNHLISNTRKRKASNLSEEEEANERAVRPCHSNSVSVSSSLLSSSSSLLT